MDSHEFKRILENGMGRAILHLKTHDPQPYHDAILEVCLHNTILDRQIENHHSNYMWEVVQASGDYSFFRHQIFDRFKALNDQDEVYDIQYLYSLMNELAGRNVKDAIQAIRQKFLDNPALGNYEGAGGVVIAEKGMSGLILVAETIGGAAYEEADWKTGRRLFAILENMYTEGVLWDRLEKRAKKNINVRDYIQAVRQKQAESKARQQTKTRLQTYADVKNLIAQLGDGLGRGNHITLSGWGGRATEADLLLVAHDLLQEQNPAYLQPYLQVFLRRPFPLDFKYLVPLVDHQDDYIARLAIFALANLKHPEIRALGFRLIAEGRLAEHAVELFKLNLEPTDWSFLAELLHLTHLDRQTYHSLGRNLRNLVEANPISDSIPLNLLLYERVPCGLCREFVVKNLHELRAVPDWMWEECRYDRDEDLREFVKENRPPLVVD